MYITVMDFSTETITKLVWDVEEAESEQVEILLERMGYHLSQISYMTTKDEPEFGGVVEVTDVLDEARLPSPKPIGTIISEFVKKNPPKFDE